jgi:hypothetical protein
MDSKAVVVSLLHLVGVFIAVRTASYLAAGAVASFAEVEEVFCWAAGVAFASLVVDGLLLTARTAVVDFFVLMGKSGPLLALAVEDMVLAGIAR